MEKYDRKIFGALFFSVFTAVLGVGIVVPLLPVYAHDLGASGVYIGLIFGSFSLSRSILLPIFGRLSDRQGRKRFIVPGLLGYAVISVAFIFAYDISSLLFIRFFHGIASAMIMPVCQAYIGDITPPGTEGTTMGLFNMSLFIGLSVGPLVGGVINDHLGLQAAFLSMGILSVCGFLLSFIFLPPTKTEKNINLDKEPTAWRELIRDRTLIGLFFFRFAYVSCIGVVWGFLPVYADSKFSLSSASIGVLIMLGVMISGLLHLPMGYVSDRMSRKLLVVCGGLITGFSVLSVELAGTYWQLVAAMVLFGVGGGVSMPALMAMAVIKGSRADAMGSVMALLTMAHSAGMLFGSLFAGLMMDFVGLSMAFPSGALVMGCGIIIFLAGTADKEPSRA